MKSMKKAFSANKVIGSLKKRTSAPDQQDEGSTAAAAAAAAAAATNGQSPEAAAHNSVKAFCESGGHVQGDEILFLPPIVDAAESSPAAAAECARLIAKFLDKSYNSRPSWQYNALMLMRILTDNPGETFTRNLGGDFPEVVRKLLKHGRDSRVRTMLMETLDDFQHTRMYDDNLKPLITMWKAQKEDALRKNPGAPLVPPQQQQAQQRAANAMSFNPHSQNYFARSHTNKRLPDTVELASRLEEARTSAKLLEQVVMNTPPAEMLQNELIKEFADRCQSASRSIQGYMVADNPAPDNDTMESLIDTNEQLQTALNQHQRAVLNARKQLGLNATSPDAEPTMSPASNGHPSDRVLAWQQSQIELHESGEPLESPDLPARQFGSGKGKEAADYTQAGGVGSGAVVHGPDVDDGEDPFRDPQPEDPNRHHFEPFNPGFNPADSSASSRRPVPPAEGANAAAPRPVKDTVPDDDLYEADERSKEPVYRY